MLEPTSDPAMDARSLLDRDIDAQLPLDVQEELRLVVLAQAGCEESTHALFTRNLRYIRVVAQRCKAPGRSLEERVNDTWGSFVMALRRYDASKGIRLMHWCRPWLKNGVRQGYLESGGPRRSSQQEGYYFDKLRAARSNLERELGRHATDEEILARASSMLPDSYGGMQIAAHWMDALRFREATFVCIHSDPENDGSGAEAVGYELADESALDPSEEAVRSDLAARVHRVLERMPPRDAEVLRLLYGVGMDHDLSQQEVAQRYGLSRQRIRQIKIRAQALFAAEDDFDILLQDWKGVYGEDD